MVLFVQYNGFFPYQVMAEMSDVRRVKVKPVGANTVGYDATTPVVSIGDKSETTD